MKKLILCLGIAASLTGCNERVREPKAAQPATATSEAPATETPAAETPAPAPEKKSDLFAVQITAVDFLKGGLEECGTKNKIFVFSTSAIEEKHLICKNSVTSIHAINQKGVVTFVSTLGEMELPVSPKYTNRFDLGKDTELRVNFENPYGFSYLIITDVTGLDTALLKEWNELNAKLSRLRAQALTLEREGQIVPAGMIDELMKLEVEMRELTEKMYNSKKVAESN